MSNPTRKMIRRNADRAIKKATPYRRLIALPNGVVMHATKGRLHDPAVLEYRMKLLLERASA